MNSKTRRIIGWVLTAILAIVLIGSGVMKLIANEELVKAVGEIGLDKSTVRMIGVIEILSMLLFIYPRTGILGTLLLSAYLGGAIATHLEHAQPIWGPVGVQCIVWITATIRFPELSRRLMGTSGTSDLSD